jgi:hypothetical protein
MMLRRYQNIYQQDRVLLCPYDQDNNKQQDIGYMMLRRQENMYQQDRLLLPYHWGNSNRHDRYNCLLM